MQPVKSAPDRKTILYVHSSDELYGSDRVLLQLVSGLDRSRYEPVVVLPADIPYEGSLGKALDESQIRHYSIKMGVLRRRYLRPLGLLLYCYYLILGIWRLNALVSRHRVDLIHSNTSAVIGGAIVARLRGLYHVWHVHEILEEPAWLVRLLYAFIRAFSDRILAVSQAVAAPLLTPGSSSKVQVVWNGVDTDRFSAAAQPDNLRKIWGADDDSVIIGVIGRISHWKGQDLFLRAAAHVANGCEKAVFLLVGDPVEGEEVRLQNLRRLVADLKLDDRARFIPFSDQVPEIMRALDILVLPSTLPEPLGLVVLEAMASGRCVIAAAHGGPLETVEHEKTGLLIAPNDVSALSAAMLDLAADPARRRSMGRNGRERAEQLFSLARFRDGINRVYAELLTS